MPRLPGTVGRPPKISSNVSRRSSNDSEDGSSSSDNNNTTKPVADHSYTAPHWLLQEKQTPKFFSVPIPTVTTATFRAVQAYLGKTGGVRSRKVRKQTTLALDKIRQLQEDQKLHRQKIKIQKEKLASAVAAKEEGLQDIRKIREGEIEEAVQELEQTLRAQQENQYKEHEEQLKQQIKEDFEKDYEAKQQLKRKVEEAEAAAKNEEPDPKKSKLEKEANIKRKSDEIKEKIGEIQAKMDKLTEKKSEMVWLLKQVIKADAKRKLQLMKLKKTEGAS